MAPEFACCEDAHVHPPCLHLLDVLKGSGSDRTATSRLSALLPVSSNRRIAPDTCDWDNSTGARFLSRKTLLVKPDDGNVVFLSAFLSEYHCADVRGTIFPWLQYSRP
uniref:Uncharacterized protein n=1 Tax=Ditylenchus dipsaci TaxID=166011 RepID=A0A915EIJ2_9BILA